MARPRGYSHPRAGRRAVGVGDSVALHPRVPRECHAPADLGSPTPTEAALDQVDAWLESPSLELLAEGEDHWNNLRDLIETGRIAGPRVHDARIAALCLGHGVRELWSADRDFSRFSSLATTNPLTA